MACRKCLSMNRVRSDLPVTSMCMEYDGHTPARVDIGPSKKNYTALLSGQIQ